MSFFVPPDLPSKSYELFGSGGGKTLAKDNSVPLLAKIPMEISVQEGGNQGKPIVITNPDSLTSRTFQTLTNDIVTALKIK